MPKNNLICLDPGHGGQDPGAVNVLDPANKGDDLYESHLALQLGYTLKSALEKLGFKVIMTRTGDVTTSLTRRVRIANDAKADLFAALHFNAGPEDKAAGFELYHDNNSARGKTFADYIGKMFQRTFPDHKYRGYFPDDQSQHHDLTVLSKTAMPAVLIEAAFISNDAEAKWALQNMSALADCIAKGLKAYYDAMP